jgi:hypothetical protein
MKRIEYRNVCDRTGWRSGPWDGEPDKVQWLDEVTCLPCLIKRAPVSGNWCGYVGVPPNHPLHGKHYDDVEVDVHGGLTYASGCSEGPQDRSICHVTEPDEPDDVWWFGFDCGHAYDVSPGLETRIPLIFDQQKVYRDQSYVEQEVRLLAEQLRMR